MAVSHQQRDQIERRIRAAIDRLLPGQIPPGDACDAKTLAREAGISRASLYRTWTHLKDEFEQRRAAARAAGQQPDPKEARIARLRELNQRLTGKLARTNTEVTLLKGASPATAVGPGGQGRRTRTAPARTEYVRHPCHPGSQPRTGGRRHERRPPHPPLMSNQRVVEGAT
ncbi:MULTISPECIES: hypothetical protein [Streptomyces]|uniref:hypothetical protein n=1 Tax=Streptomyces TaxID=1883 RepID=UPI000B1E39C6|nr:MULTISPECIES: hypothetical protein [Streptomyces]MDI5905446.1 hypothetical protein [Streptomyces sp. 12257]